MQLAVLLRHGEYCTGVEDLDRVQPAVHERLEGLHTDMMDVEVSTPSPRAPHSVWLHHSGYVCVAGEEDESHQVGCPRVRGSGVGRAGPSGRGAVLPLPRSLRSSQSDTATCCCCHLLLLQRPASQLNCCCSAQPLNCSPICAGPVCRAGTRFGRAWTPKSTRCTPAHGQSGRG